MKAEFVAETPAGTEPLQFHGNARRKQPLKY